jgi:hypothetical protein
MKGGAEEDVGAPHILKIEQEDGHPPRLGHDQEGQVWAILSRITSPRNLHRIRLMAGCVKAF